MSSLSPQLTRLLLVRGLARALAPIAVLWSIYDWWLIRPAYAAIFGFLTLNYVLVYILSWIAPSAQDGPWRIRPWQTFALIANAVVLPIVFKKRYGLLPWGFIAISVIFFIGLYAATVILFYLNKRLPMAGIFANRRGLSIPPLPLKKSPVANSP